MATGSWAPGPAQQHPARSPGWAGCGGLPVARDAPFRPPVQNTGRRGGAGRVGAEPRSVCHVLRHGVDACHRLPLSLSTIWQGDGWGSGEPVSPDHCRCITAQVESSPCLLCRPGWPQWGLPPGPALSCPPFPAELKSPLSQETGSATRPGGLRPTVAPKAGGFLRAASGPDSAVG